MRMLLAVALCLAAAPAAAAPDAGPPAGPGTVRAFRTQATPRIDPVFGSVAALRTAVDQFLALQTEMERVRNDFGTGVHRTLALLSGGRSCPPAVPAAYGRALEAGQRYLGLGRRLEARFRDIRRSEDLGETAGLTPDYRLKVKRTRELYAVLLRDYREMRASFRDQLGAELRHAGCQIEAGATPGPRPAGAPDPANPEDWELTPLTDRTAAEAPATTGAASSARPADGGGGPAIWIAIDNTRCGEPSVLTLDGAPVGDIPAGKKTQVRARAGPHALCVLPASDPRPCGAAGTVRRAYLYEGWSLAVRCGK
jgi:hypothetical protein